MQQPVSQSASCHIGHTRMLAMLGTAAGARAPCGMMWYVVPPSPRVLNTTYPAVLWPGTWALRLSQSRTPHTHCAAQPPRYSQKFDVMSRPITGGGEHLQPGLAISPVLNTERLHTLLKRGMLEERLCQMELPELMRLAESIVARSYEL